MTRAEAARGADPAEIPLTRLRGVGPVRARRLERLGLRSVRDLLVLAPRSVLRQGGQVAIGEAEQRIGEDVSVLGTLGPPRIFRQGRRRSVLSADLRDGSGVLQVMFFNQPWMLEPLRALAQAGAEVELYGRIVETKKGPALSAPRIATAERPLPEPGTIHPVYPLTDGIGQAFLRDLCRQAVEEHVGALEDPLSQEERAPFTLPDLATAVRELHRPRSEERFELARRRLALERILAVQARLERSREAQDGGRARAVILDDEARALLRRRLPFRPTRAQARAMDEIQQDLARTRPMRRLLQGDVGSGKTLIGLHAAMAVCLAGGQAALLVPTEILAEQHYLGLRPGLERAGLRTGLLTGSLPREEQREVRGALASGAIQVAVGTHALFARGVRFARLDLAVIDEQQRFGVAQKRALLEKGRDVHLLLMTATPIPRTLALSLYGDLEKSVLDEGPPGRGGVRTKVVPSSRRRRMLRFIAERLAEGERVFWICPRIGGDDDEADTGVAAAEHAFARLRRPFEAFGVELVHGGIESGERARRIDRFRTGEVGLLVGTSVLEVGVDVPEATVMVIEGAERFGLAQLHQLRGRIGRGARASWCFLLGEPAGLERMRFLEETRDGFAIAEEDLRRRGMGDLAGLRQAGVNVEGFADPFTDLELVGHARRLIRGDRGLAERYAALGVDVPAIV